MAISVSWAHVPPLLATSLWVASVLKMANVTASRATPGLIARHCSGSQKGLLKCFLRAQSSPWISSVSSFLRSTVEVAPDVDKFGCYSRHEEACQSQEEGMCNCLQSTVQARFRQRANRASEFRPLNRFQITWRSLQYACRS